MPLTIGTRLGPYEIVAPLGAGGMGEVYRARDAKLNRDVAIKVLLPAVANDPDRLARFSREAQVLASLNHPNIAHGYGLDRQEGRDGQDGTAFIVMELVDGQELAQRVARGPIPLDEALPMARQIAEALPFPTPMKSSSHARRVTWRSLQTHRRWRSWASVKAERAFGFDASTRKRRARSRAPKGRRHWRGRLTGDRSRSAPIAG